MGMNVGTLVVSMRGDIAPLLGSFKQVGLGLRQLTLGLRQFGIGAVAAGAPLAALGKKAVGLFMPFEKELTRAMSVLGGSKAIFDTLAVSTKKLATQGEFTAGQLAEGFSIIAQRGLNAADSIKSMPAVMQLASAAQTDLAKSGAILLNIMNSQRASVAELPRYMDALVAGANLSATSVEELGTAFRFVGGSIQSLGLSVEEGTAALAVLQEQGQVASIAGRGLRQFVGSLLKANVAGGATHDAMVALGLDTLFLGKKFPTLAQIAERLTEAQARLGDETKYTSLLFSLLPANAVTVAQAFSGMSGRIRELTTNIEGMSGVTEKVAKDQLNTLTGQLRVLQSRFENVAITIGEDMVPMIKKLADGLAGVVDWFNSLSKEARVAIIEYTAIGAAALATVTAISGLAFVLEPIIGTIVALGRVIVTSLSLPLLAAGAAVVGVIMGAGAFKRAWEADLFSVQSGLEDLVDTFRKAKTWFKEAAPWEDWGKTAATVFRSIRDDALRLFLFFKKNFDEFGEWNEARRKRSLAQTEQGFGRKGPLPPAREFNLQGVTDDEVKIAAEELGNAVDEFGDWVKSINLGRFADPFGMTLPEINIGNIADVYKAVYSAAGTLFTNPVKSILSVGSGMSSEEIEAKPAKEFIQDFRREFGPTWNAGVDVITDAILKLKDSMGFGDMDLMSLIPPELAGAWEKLKDVSATVRAELERLREAIRNGKNEIETPPIERVSQEKDLRPLITWLTSRPGLEADQAVETARDQTGSFLNPNTLRSTMMDAMTEAVRSIGGNASVDELQTVLGGPMLALEAWLKDNPKITEKLEEIKEGGVKPSGTGVPSGAEMAFIKNLIVPRVDRNQVTGETTVSGGITDSLGSLGSAIETFIQAGSAMAGVVGVILQLIMGSEQFKTIVEVLNKIFARIGSTLGRFFDGLEPIIGAISILVDAVITPLGDVFAILGQSLARFAPIIVAIADILKPIIEVMVSVLVPILNLLNSVLSTVAMTMYAVVKVVGLGLIGILLGITWVWNQIAGALTGIIDGVISAIQWVLRKIDDVVSWLIGDVLDPVADSLESLKLGDLTIDRSGLLATKNQLAEDIGNFGEEVGGVADQFTEDMGRAQREFDSLADTTERLNEELRNVPAGFKVALARFNAQDTESTRVGLGGSGGGGGNLLTTLIGTAVGAGASGGATRVGTGGGIRLPRMARGGVVTHPTIAEIGESGPEAVIPLKDMGSMGGGNLYVDTVVVQANNPEAFMRELKARARREGLAKGKIGNAAPRGTGGTR